MQTPSFNFQKRTPEYRMLFAGLQFRLWLSVGILGLVIAARMGAGILTSFFNSRTESVKAEMRELSPKWSNKLEYSILSLPSRVEAVKTLLNNHIYGSKLFDFLRENTSKKVVITSVSVDAKALSLEMQAQAASYNDLAEQIVWLKSLRRIEDLKLSGISLGDKGLINFSLALKLSPAFFKNTQ